MAKGEQPITVWPPDFRPADVGLVGEDRDVWQALEQQISTGAAMSAGDIASVPAAVGDGMLRDHDNVSERL
jgi:hypothetical protein